MKKILYIFLFFSVFAFGQRTIDSQGYLERWDDYTDGIGGWWDKAGFIGTFPWADEGLVFYNAFIESKNNKAMYGKGYGQIGSRTRVFQALGRNSDFDEILLLAEGDLLHGESTTSYIARTGRNIGGFTSPNDGFDSWYVEPTFGDADIGLSVQEAIDYVANSEGFNFGLGGIQGGDTTIGAQRSLFEGIYIRYVLNAIRIAYKYPSFYNQISDDGVNTYKQRMDVLVNICINSFWNKWTSRDLDDHVHLTDRHRSSHYAMVALCLYSITGEQQYFDFAYSYFNDFSVRLDGQPAANLNPGENFWTGFQVVNVSPTVGDRYVYVGSWQKNPFQSAQDITHAGGGEADLLYTAWQEGGYGITQYQMDTYLNTIKYGWCDWDRFVNTGVRDIFFRNDQTESQGEFGSGANIQGIVVWAEYDKSGELLEFFEGLPVNGAGTAKGSHSGYSYYASRSIENALVYPDFRVGTTPPIVNPPTNETRTAVPVLTTH